MTDHVGGDITLPRDAVWMALRYGLGRGTYADRIARDVLRAAWPHLSEGEKRLNLDILPTAKAGGFQD